MSMTTEKENTDSSPVKQGQIFLKGFGVRFIYGVLGCIPIFLLRPDLLRDKPQVLLYSICLYLVVCIVGGLVDASARRAAKLQLFNIRQPSSIFNLVLYLVILLLLWVRR